uniref:Uncharacterized protein n=1 Tax=Anguilla anguilla TaxID=7936 RepID=A0A0E9P6X4_ANGAN
MYQGLAAMHKKQDFVDFFQAYQLEKP